MIKKTLWLCLFLLVAFTLKVKAQNNLDTLQLSRNYSNTQDFKSAIYILETYSQNHPNNIFATQLLAQNYYWNGNLEKADSTYLFGINKHANHQDLKLDYARMLFNQGKTKQTKKVLDDYLENDPDNIEALEYSGYINYWWGRHRQALGNFNNILKQYPNNATALAMVKTIKRIMQPYILGGYQFSIDSQPMESGNAFIELGKYKSRLFQPTVKLDFIHFKTEETNTRTPWIQASNTMHFFKNNTQLKATLGFLEYVNANAHLTGALSLNQSLGSQLSLTVIAESNPYFYTSSSLLQPVYFNGLNASLNWETRVGVNAKAFVGKQYFMDGNQIENAYAWAMSPNFSWGNIKLNLGYSYSYTNSSVNHFESKLTLDEILNDYQPGAIEGIYNPYFTPINQNIHSVLGSISFFTNKKLELKIKGSVGVYAFADIPYLFLDKNSSDDIFINQGFSKEYKTPYEFNLIAIYQINKKTTLNANYTYTENFFYHNNLFNLNIKYLF